MKEDRIIELLTSIDETQKALLADQRAQDQKMEGLLASFAPEEEKPQKTTDPFYNQNLVKFAQAKAEGKPFSPFDGV